MELYFIRHGKTKGNIEKRYIGSTDENLCKEGKEELVFSKYSFVEKIYSSPMKRCLQTAEIMCPNKEINIIEGLKESDFGDFEYKTYEDLKNTASYIKWIESGGKMGFPNGESNTEMKERCINAFEIIKKDMFKNGINTAAVFTHGGTIMAVCEYLTGDFYSWHVENGAAVKVVVENGKVECKKI